MPHQLSQYNDYTTAWTIQGSNPGRGRRYNSSDLIIHAHIVSRLRIKGAMTPPPLI